MTSKRKRVQDYLLKKISGNLKPGDLLPTVNDLSSTLSVSPMTVHKAVNELVNQNILVKIQGKGTFVGDSAPGIVTNASSSSKSSKKSIAFISPFLHDDEFMAGFTNGALEMLDHQNFFLSTIHVWLPQMNEVEMIEEAASRHDAIILLPSSVDDTQGITSHLWQQNYPLVYIDKYPMNQPCCAICSDNEEGAAMAVEYLINQGHRRILYITHAIDESSITARRSGYEDTLKRNRLSPEILEIPQTGSVNLDQYFSKPKTTWPTAIFTLHDGIAIDTYNYLSEKGISVPDDVSIVGFNNDIGTADLTPPLTTVSQPKKEIGRKAIKMIQGMLNGTPIENSKFFIQCQLEERDSVKTLYNKLETTKVG